MIKRIKFALVALLSLLFLYSCCVPCTNRMNRPPKRAKKTSLSKPIPTPPKTAHIQVLKPFKIKKQGLVASLHKKNKNIKQYTIKGPAISLSNQIEKLAKILYKQLPKDSAKGPIIVTTFVDLNNFYRTCPLGRLLTEELIGDLQRLGLNIIEMRRSNAIFVKQRFGEFALSRDVNQLAKKWRVRYILVGTYFEKGGFLIINARLVSKKGDEIISSASTIINVNRYIASLLTPTTTSNIEPMTSIPVKSLDSIIKKTDKNSNVITINLNPPNKQS